MEEDFYADYNPYDSMDLGTDKFTVEEFIQEVIYGSFNDYDGIGFFGYNNEESDDQIYCNPEWIKNNKKDFTHIYWYNK